jgi:hypothetical protein
MTPDSEKVLALVFAWLNGNFESLMYDACPDEPEIAWGAILEILKRELTEDQMALLAAGPMEDLMVHHGSTFTNRVEQEAKVNDRFNNLLGESLASRNASRNLGASGDCTQGGLVILASF